MRKLLISVLIILCIIMLVACYNSPEKQIMDMACEQLGVHPIKMNLLEVAHGYVPNMKCNIYYYHLTCDMDVYYVRVYRSGDEIISVEVEEKIY